MEYLIEFKKTKKTKNAFARVRDVNRFYLSRFLDGLITWERKKGKMNRSRSNYSSIVPIKIAEGKNALRPDERSSLRDEIIEQTPKRNSVPRKCANWNRASRFQPFRIAGRPAQFLLFPNGTGNK